MEQNYSNRGKRTLYLSNINLYTSIDHIYQTFSQAGPVEKVNLHENIDGTPQYAVVVFKEINSVMHVMADYNRYQLGFNIIHCLSNMIYSSNIPSELSNQWNISRQIGYEKKCAQQSHPYNIRVFENSNYKKNDTMREIATTISSNDGWNPFNSSLKSPITSSNFLKFNSTI
ncbi:unnamed protein product [Wuchereria bancrofti]|uniref:RRM domain-containing protein n=2 Tax=Wuchereria bancrofti TaxID=6293 RepID=A0A3P7FFH5_WUCBA|nr:unnamed protein product [Wuchereria bancrofti]